MFKKRIISILALIIVFATLLATPVLAYLYRAPIAINSIAGVTRSYPQVIKRVNNTWLAANGFITASGRDTRVENLSGLQYGRMVLGDNLVFSSPSIAALGQSNLYYTTQNSLTATMDMIAGYRGYIGIADNAALEFANNFGIDTYGYYNPDTLDTALLYKPSAFIVGNSAPGTIQATITAASNVIIGTGGAMALSSYPSTTHYLGQTFTTPATGFWCDRVDMTQTALVGDPFGKGYRLSIRATAGGLPTGPDLTGASLYRHPGGGWITSSWVFDSPVWLNAATMYAIVITTDNGWNPDGVSYVGIGASNVNPYAGGTYVDSVDGGVSWVSTAANDYTCNVYGQSSTRSVSVAGITAGMRRIEVTGAPAGNLTLNVYDADEVTLLGTNSVGIAAVLNNADNWRVNNGFLSYLRYYRQTIAGVEQVRYQPTTIPANMTTAGSLEYPAYVQTGEGTTAIASTTHTINVSNKSGTEDIMILLFATQAAPTSVSWPAGWTTLFTAASGVNTTLSAAYKTFGGESTVTITTGAAVRSSGLILSIGRYSGVPVAGVAVTGAGAANPDPPNLVSGFGAVRQSWLAVAADSAATSYAGILNWTNQYTINPAATTPYIAYARSDQTAANVNPAAFTAGAGDWVANTISICTDIPYTIPNIDAGGLYPGTLQLGYNYGLSVNMGSMVSANQPEPGVNTGDTPRDVLNDVNVSDWYQDPDIAGSLATNPLRPFVQILSNTTDLTELQSWRFLGLAFVLFITVTAAVAVRGHLLIAGIACGAAIGLLTQQTVWPTWALVFIVPAILGGLIAERTPSV